MLVLILGLHFNRERDMSEAEHQNHQPLFAGIMRGERLAIEMVKRRRQQGAGGFKKGGARGLYWRNRCGDTLPARVFRASLQLRSRIALEPDHNRMFQIRNAPGHNCKGRMFR
jgi:hypothetical protein